MIRQLARGEVDLVLGRQTEGHGEGDFISVPLVGETQVVVARARHPLARKSSVTLADLTCLPCMLQPPGSPQRIRLDATLRDICPAPRPTRTALDPNLPNNPNH